MITKSKAINEYSFSYKGLFKLSEIYQIMDTFFIERDYDKDDDKHQVIDGKNGRVFEIETYYKKQYNDTEYFIMEFTITATNIKTVKKVVHGVEQEFQDGNIEIVYNGWIYDESESWREDTWKVLINYIATFHIFKHHLDKFKADAKHDSEQIYQLILDYFNAKKILR